MAVEVYVEDLKTIIPPQWPYEIICIENFGSNPEKTEIRLKVGLFNADDVKQWLERLEVNTSCTYSIRTTEKGVGKKVVFKQKLQCHHHTRHKQVYEPNSKCRTRNTNCPSNLNITIQALRKKFRGNPDNAPDPKMPCLIDYIITHNHEIKSTAVKYNRVSPTVKAKLLELFNSGHTPITALEYIKSEILVSSENYIEMLEDRRFCPNYHYCYYLYTTEFKKSLTAELEIANKKLKAANDLIGTYNEENIDVENDGLLNNEECVVQEIIVQPDTAVNDDILIDKGKEVIQKLTENLESRLHESPADVLPALEIFFNQSRKLKLSSFITSCSSFGQESRKKAKTDKLLLAVTEDFRIGDS